MYQNSHNQPEENQQRSGRAQKENRNLNSYEGFEGMNYEQIRQPYNPHGGRKNNGDERSDRNGGKRPDEF